MTEMGKPKEGLPLSMTSLALDRTILANERTCAAWIRTGISALIAGLAVEKFSLQAIPIWGVHIIAATLILFSTVTFFIASWRFRHFLIRRKDVDVQMIPFPLVLAVSIALAICAIISLAGLWLV